MRNNKLLERLDQHLHSIKEEFFYIKTKYINPKEYSKRKYDADTLDQQNSYVEIAKNPTSNELSQLLKYSERGLVRGVAIIKFTKSRDFYLKLEDVYFWDASKMIHEDLCKYTGLKDNETCINFIIDKSRRIVRHDFQNENSEVGWQDGIIEPRDDRSWVKVMYDLIDKYSLKPDSKDKKCWDDTYKGVDEEGNPLLYGVGEVQYRLDDFSLKVGNNMWDTEFMDIPNEDCIVWGNRNYLNKIKLVLPQNIDKPYSYEYLICIGVKNKFSNKNIKWEIKDRISAKFENIDKFINILKNRLKAIVNKYQSVLMEDK